MIIDVEALRWELENYYGTAMSSGFPMAVMDLSRVERMTPQELVWEAQKLGMDLRRVEVVEDTD